MRQRLHTLRQEDTLSRTQSIGVDETKTTYYISSRRFVMYSVRGMKQKLHYTLHVVKTLCHVLIRWG